MTVFSILSDIVSQADSMQCSAGQCSAVDDVSRLLMCTAVEGAVLWS